MLTDYESHLTLRYLCSMASRLQWSSAQAQAMAGWLNENGSLMGMDAEVAVRSGRRRRGRPPAEAGNGISAKDWKLLRQALQGRLVELGQMEPDSFSAHLVRLSRLVGLQPLDVAIIELLYRYQTLGCVESLLDEVFDRRTMFGGRVNNAKSAALPFVLGVRQSDVFSRLGDDAPLVRSGLLRVDPDGDLSLVDRIHRLALVAPTNEGDLRGVLLSEAEPTELDWCDYDHVAEGRDHILSLLQGALLEGTRGVNVLLYGPPGTGKTELSKALAARLGVGLFAVGECDDGGQEPTRGERLSELKLAQHLLRDAGDSLLLFDEIDDLLGDGCFGANPFLKLLLGGKSNAGSSLSKVYLNRLLERTPVPIVWTTNNADAIDPAILRRMMFALELRLPPPRVRARVWQRMLQRSNIAATPNEIEALSREFVAVPAVAAGAVAAARLGGGDIQAVRSGVDSLSRLLGHGAHHTQAGSTRFSSDLITADQNVGSLVDRLCGLTMRNFSLSLQGPPGTGKSAFVRYLAERLDMEVLQKRASDLISPWVGMSERHIADAFAEARDNKAFLIFDEADSLLADRRGAARSWEVRQVNEMLTWMESHPLPFACTTNLGERQDPAALRRFVFKLTFGYMTPDQVDAAFRQFFACPAPLSALALSVLTPGDFALVRRKAEMLGLLSDADAIAEFLEGECRAKPEMPGRIGFQVSHHRAH